jgi:type II secretory ATPase GspE/PulE/Tfp pilus assembly ATPase PilB-like protein
MYNPYQLQFLDICSFALAKRASDIHIEPIDDGLRIRIRTNGELSDLATFGKQAAGHFLESVKTLLKFDMSKLGVPQDTRFRHPQARVNFRGSLLPTSYGEKICLRLLPRDVNFSLDTYSLEENAKRAIRELTLKKEGLILISGPTGSGKSTLMYSALGSIDRIKKCVYTVEDPIEYEMGGLIQVPVDHKKITFPKALRTLMRQDPDVIMVGEIRDEETAKIAVTAAGTGHLVIATVHANSALQVLARMRNLGVSDYDLKSVLLMSSAQRLVRISCPCSKGCDECSFTGVNSRKLVFEALIKKDGNLQRLGSIDESLASLFAKGQITHEEFNSSKAI